MKLGAVFHLQYIGVHQFIFLSKTTHQYKNQTLHERKIYPIQQLVKWYFRFSEKDTRYTLGYDFSCWCCYCYFLIHSVCYITKHLNFIFMDILICDINIWFILGLSHVMILLFNFLCCWPPLQKENQTLVCFKNIYILKRDIIRYFKFMTKFCLLINLKTRIPIYTELLK